MLNTPHNFRLSCFRARRKTYPEVEKELRNETGENYATLWVLRESDTVWCCRGFHSRVSSFHSHPPGGIERAGSQGKEGKTAFSASAERSEAWERWAYVF